MGNYQEWRNGKDRLKKGYYETEFLWKCRCLVVIMYLGINGKKKKKKSMQHHLLVVTARRHGNLWK